MGSRRGRRRPKRKDPSELQEHKERRIGGVAKVNPLDLEVLRNQLSDISLDIRGMQDLRQASAKQVDQPQRSAKQECVVKQVEVPMKPTKQGDAPKKRTKQGNAPMSAKQGDAMLTKQRYAPKKTSVKQTSAKQGDAPKQTLAKQGEATKKMSAKRGDTPKTSAMQADATIGDAPKMLAKQENAQQDFLKEQVDALEDFPGDLPAKQRDAPKKRSAKRGHAPKKSAKQGDMPGDMPAKQEHAPKKPAKQRDAPKKSAKEQQDVPVKQEDMSKKQKKPAKHLCVPPQCIILGKKHYPGKSLKSPLSLEYLCVVDFEATCEKGQPDYVHEIIEFPVVLVNLHKRCVEGYFREYVRPLVIPQLTDFCMELTGIKQEVVDGAETFPTVFLHAVEWMQQLGLGTRHTFCILTDGSYDMSRFLYQQCELSSLKFPTFARRWINVRKSFARYAKVPKNSVQLKYMLEGLGLQFEGRPHSGLDDAKNIARIALALADRGCQLQPNEALEMHKDYGRLVSLRGAERFKPAPSVCYPESR
uniref:3'-5' exonuclease eri-1-like isoform X1 n=2 Tax=Myxine glutinosa TaxID=7769 RepID=UPI00358F9423